MSKPDVRICLNRVKKERAMLIKDSNGDWGVCIASWAGLQKGVPGVPGMAIGRHVLTLRALLKTV